MAINKFLYTIWAAENGLICIVVGLLIAAYSIVSNAIGCLTTTPAYNTSGAKSHAKVFNYKSKSTLRSFISIICFSLSIMQYTYVDIFGGKDQPMQILIVVAVITFLQKY